MNFMKPLPFIEINPRLCARCGTCVHDCLAGILFFPERSSSEADSVSSLPEFCEGGAERCFQCQHCLAVCPTGALSFAGKRPEDSFPIGKLPEPELVRNLLRQRRSIRDYRRENVSAEIMRELRNVMDFVPTGCNDHRLRFTWSSDVKVTDSFRERVSSWLQERELTGTLPASLARFAAFIPALKSGKDIFFRNAPHFVAISVPPEAKDAHIDPFIAASQLEILASAFGLGTCWAGMATDLFNGSDELYEKLNIPDGFVLKIVLLFGIPAVHYARVPQPEPCVHQELET